MSKLRRIEEERRRPREMPFDEREKIIELIRQILKKEEYIELAVIHGGFLTSKVFRDIDIAVYIDNRLEPDKRYIYIDGIRDSLEKAIGIGIDIQILNEAPPAFIYKVLRDGRIIVEKRIGISSILKIHALEDMRRLRRASLLYSKKPYDD